jgi:hypothetical protein
MAEPAVAGSPRHLHLLIRAIQMRSACTFEDPSVTPWQRLEMRCVHATRGLEAGHPEFRRRGNRASDGPLWFNPSIAHPSGRVGTVGLSGWSAAATGDRECMSVASTDAPPEVNRTASLDR